MTDGNCLDCRTSSRGTCPVHADSDSVDLEIARLKAENARLTQRLGEPLQICPDGVVRRAPADDDELREAGAEIARLKAGLEEVGGLYQRLREEYAGKCFRASSAENELSRLTEENRRLSEMVHKSEGMANEVNVLVKENRKLRETLTAIACADPPGFDAQWPRRIAAKALSTGDSE